jgi:hypothetical protein
MTYNYVHDNTGVGMWCDTVHNVGGAGSSCQFTGNTVINNAAYGIMHEVSNNGDIGFNVVYGNGSGPCYGAFCGNGDPYNFPPGIDILLSDSSTTVVHDNNVTSTNNEHAILATKSNRCCDPPADDGQNIILRNNTVTFLSGLGQYGGVHHADGSAPLAASSFSEQQHLLGYVRQQFALAVECR